MQKILSITPDNLRLIEKRLPPGWPRHLLAAGLLTIWLLVLLGGATYLTLQPASWLTFLGLLIAPGYFLADMMTWRLRLDWLEKLALAFPLGVAILAGPGVVALLLHLTILELTIGWMLVTALMIIAWLGHGLRFRLRSRLARSWTRTQQPPWAIDELIMALLLAVAFLLFLPILAQPKIDGDAYAVNTFVVDALAGLPLNATEPLFGTDLGPGVRMIFNQSLPLTYLWAHLAHIDPIALTAAASRPMIALWIILASYTLGKSAGAGDRRFGLLTASIQLLIYLAAPFMRGDNVTLFFFERTNADKFMVPTVMLPVVFAFTLRYVREGRGAAWGAAAVATFAVSAIHPLIAAMQALALTAFGGLHLLFNLRRREAWGRVLAVAGLAALVMALPVAQLVMARGEAPLAPSYPASFAGWPLGKKLSPVLPFIHAQTLDLYGPLPDLAQLEAGQANTAADPFLIWRFAVNMNRQRLLIFDLNRYISDPNLLMEPPYLLALFLLPLLLWRIRTNPAAQFAVGTTAAILFVMFNPLVTPLIGGLVMPWILWRFVWLLPYALIIALSLDQLARWSQATINRRLQFEKTLRRLTYRLEVVDPLKIGLMARLLSYAIRNTQYAIRNTPRIAYFHCRAVRLCLSPLCFVALAGLLLSPLMVRNFQNLASRSGAPVFYPAPKRLLTYLDQATARDGPAMVLADPALSVTIPAFVARAQVVAHRAPTTSEVFPADQQDAALQRLIDQHTFFNTPYLTPETVDILQRYDVRYVVVQGGGDVDAQLRLAPHWFERLVDDQSYRLYRVKQIPPVTAGLRGNTALLDRQWAVAEQLYQIALEESPQDWLAWLGLAHIAQARGQFDLALERLQTPAAHLELPIVHYHLGRLYAKAGQVERSVVAFEKAQAAAPAISRFHIALGDACLRVDRLACVVEQYQAAVANQSWPDEASRLIAQADLWRRQERLDQAIPLYEKAAALNPNLFNQFVLERAYRDNGWLEQSVALLRRLRLQYPLSTEVWSTLAEATAAQNNLDQAVRLYRLAIFLQDIQAQETVDTRLALARALLARGRLAEAGREVNAVLRLAPYNAAAYRLQGDVLRQSGQAERAVEAYQLAFQLDPTQIAAYTALSSQLRQRGYLPDVAPTLLQQAIQANPDEPILHLAWGDQRRLLGDLPAAIEAYQSVLSRLDSYDPFARPRPRFTAQSRAVVYARLARAYEDLGQLEPAMNYYQAAEAAAPYLPWPHVLFGDALRRRNEMEAAEAAYRHALQRSPAYIETYVRLADLLSAQGHVAEANDLYETASQLTLTQTGLNRQTGEALPAQPSRPPPTLESGETLQTVGYLPERLSGETVVAYRNAVAANENVEAVRVLARLSQISPHVEQIIRFYQMSIEQGQVEQQLPTTLAQYYKSLGDIYLRQGRLDQAIETYRQAFDLNKGWPAASLGLAEALSKRGHVSEALDHLQQAAAVAPGAVEVQLALADLLDRSGRPEQALSIYEATARAYPGRARAVLAAARARRAGGRLPEAEQLYRETLALNPGVIEAYVDFAELLIDRASYDEAETLLRRGLTIDQHNANVYLRLGELEERRGNFDQAPIWYQRAAALPLSAQSPNLTLIDSLLRYGDYETALTYIQDSLRRQPGHSELLLRLGRVQRRLGQYTAAETTLAEAMQLDQTNDRLWAEEASLFLDRGQAQEAIAHYQQAITLQPDAVFYYLTLSQILITQSRFDDARAVLETGQSQAAQPAALYSALANLHLQQGQPDLALATLEQGIADIGETSPMLIAMGTYYMERGDFEQVERRYSQALALRPEEAAVHTALADLALRRDETAAALAGYRQAVALEPANPHHHLALANAYRRAGQVEEAIATYTQVLTTTPTLVTAYVNLAALYREQDRRDEAQAVYEQGLVVAPTARRLIAQYSLFLFEQGDPEGALALLDQAIQNGPAAALLAARASLYHDLGRVAEAEQDLQRAGRLEPGDQATLIALGDLYRDQEDLNRAEAMYQAAVSLLPGVPTPYLRLGDLASRRGDIDAARKYAKTAHDLEPGSLVRPDTVQ